MSCCYSPSYRRAVSWLKICHIHLVTSTLLVAGWFKNWEKGIQCNSTTNKPHYTHIKKNFDWMIAKSITLLTALYCERSSSNFLLKQFKGMFSCSWSWTAAIFHSRKYILLYTYEKSIQQSYPSWCKDDIIKIYKLLKSLNGFVACMHFELNLLLGVTKQPFRCYQKLLELPRLQRTCVI